jgi:hypothetical protein
VDRGCKEDSPIPNKWKLGDYSFNRCPSSISTVSSKEYINAYSLWKENKLPNGKGWINESHKFIEAMFIINNQVSEIKDDRQ